MTEEVDVLAIGAHPDDIEICCGGTVAQLVARGRRVGLVDLSLGELGTRGMVETRRREAQRAGEILGVCFRTNLGLPDGEIRPSAESRNQLIRLFPCLSARVDSKSLRGWTPGPLERNRPGERGRTPCRARETGAGVSSPSSRGRCFVAAVRFPRHAGCGGEYLGDDGDQGRGHPGPRLPAPRPTIGRTRHNSDRCRVPRPNPGPQSVHGEPCRLQVRGRIPALESAPGTGS